MLNICMLVHNRPRLTRQALESLVENTQGPFNLTIVDDHSGDETKQIVLDWTQVYFGLPARFGRAPKQLGPGRARNEGIRLSEHFFGRPGLLYLCDNDCWFSPGWDTALLEVWNSDLRRGMGFEAIGGYCHPYQQPISQIRATTEHSIAELQALGLFSWLMEWETWDKYGPFLPAPSINGSEDWAFSQRIRLGSGRVGVVVPQLCVNCGATSSDGKPCPGAALLYQQKIPVGVVIE